MVDRDPVVSRIVSFWEPQRSGLTRSLGPGSAADAIPSVPTVPGLTKDRELLIFR